MSEMRLTIHTQGTGICDAAGLVSGESILIGRRPNSAELPNGATRELPVLSPSVSANHAMVAHEGDRLIVTDLGSRNGTWLELPPLVPVSLAVPEEMRLRLAPSMLDGKHDLPAAADWRPGEDYGAAVARVIDEWLRRRGTPARVEVVRRAPVDREDLPGRIALPGDRDLLVRAEDTMDPQWLEVLGRVARYVSRQNTQFAAEDELREQGITVASPAMRQVLRQVIEAAERGARALLLIGPSGSGKEGLARCFHQHSTGPGPFVSRNCATFHFGKDMILSELFGADAGSFTGAVRPLTGAVEAAQGGTLFLDEIGDLPLDVQAALLRFLDRGEYQRLGSSRPMQANVRVVGATNKDLRAACLRGEFRRDLWFRLSIEVLDVPPLSQRFEDVVAYLRGRALDGGSLYDALSSEAVELLRHHPWEGNFRELINFAGRLPRGRSHFDADTCRQALAAGALHPVASPPPPPLDAAQDWMAMARRAAEAFVEDHDTPAPRSWDEVKTFVECYLKPLLFAHLSGADRCAGPEAVDMRVLAERLHADRGTAAKQLERFFVRFAAHS